MRHVAMLLLMLLVIGAAGYAQAGKARVDLQMNKAFYGDTAFVSVDYFTALQGDIPAPRHYEAVIDRQGKAGFVLDLPDTLAYFSVTFTHSKLPFPVRPGLEVLYDYLIADGDVIHIDVRYNDSVFHAGPPVKRDSVLIFPVQYHEKNIVSFSGKGSNKLLAADDGRFREYRLPWVKDDPILFTKNGTYNLHYDRFRHQLVKVDTMMNRWRSRVDPGVLRILRADLIGDIGMETEGEVPFHFHSNPMSGLMFMGNRPYVLENIRTASQDLTAHDKLFSKEYVNGLFSMERMCFYFSGDTNYAFFYDLIKQTYTGEMRDKMWNSLFHRSSEKMSDKDSLLADADSNMTLPYYRKALSAYTARSTGKAVYDCKLPGLDGRERALSDLRGKVVLIDLYYTGCPHCIEMYNDCLHGVETYFKDSKELVFLSICADDNPATWKQTVAEGKYTSPDGGNVINLNTRGFQHPFLKNYNITAYPCTMLIDRQGTIISFDDGGMRKPDYMMAALKKAVGEERGNR